LGKDGSLFDGDSPQETAKERSMSKLLLKPSDPAGMQRERARLARQPGRQFVDAGEFVALAVSWRKMERRNISSCDLLGLYDLESNEWFLIEEEKFAEHLLAATEAE
jgi:hypothetical protein